MYKFVHSYNDKFIHMAGFDAFFKSAFTVDNIIFGFDEGDLKVLLIKRGIEPYPNTWALPGDFVYPDEDLDSSAKRILKELTGLQDVYLEQVSTFGAVDRHPFGRVITIAYYSLIKIDKYIVTPASFAKKARWHSIGDVPNMPFDHNEILKACCLRLKSQVKTQPVGFELLPPKFTLTELQHLYEAIIGKKYEKRNFRKKMLSMGLLKDLKEMQQGVAHRPARLYSFDPAIYQQLKAEGFNFEVKEVKKKEVES